MSAGEKKVYKQQLGEYIRKAAKVFLCRWLIES